jgi:hypothetical protein
MDDQWVDYLIEGVGGLHPLTPLLSTGFFGFCTCKYEATYASLTDTLVLSDTMIFGGYSNYQFCQTASLTENEKASRIKVYPNPVTGNSFTIEMDVNSSIVEVNLYDIQGKQIEIEYAISNEKNNCVVSTNNLSKGFYNILIVSDSKYYRRKIIVR